MGDAGPQGVNVIDIRQDKTNGSLSQYVIDSLNPRDGSPPSLPTLLLYDERGLQLFEEITYVDEYYLTNAEIETLQLHAKRIAAFIPEGTRLLELGSGNLRKIGILLEAFEEARKKVEYYALDLSFSELQRTFSQIDPDKWQYVSLNALHGTYNDALTWLVDQSKAPHSTCVMTLGSSIGNFTRRAAADFLTGFKNNLRSSDFILVGLDACQDEQRVFSAYNDTAGITAKFYRNGLDHANRLLQQQIFEQDQWDLDCFYDSIDNKHQASYIALRDIESPLLTIKKGGKVFLEHAYKYSQAESDKLWHDSGLVQQMAYANKSGDYQLHLLSPSEINFSDSALEYASQPVPSLEDWEKLWSAWDTVTKSMVPRDELMNKPIHLRNNLIFYLGHIPTFADIHFTRATGAKPIEPAYYVSIFERGIDPDVDNPEICHAHSEIPDTWPPLDGILEYSARVRARIRTSIQSGQAYKDRKLARGLWLGYEHEAMHLETFLYMLLQSSRVLPPPGRETPNFEQMAKDAKRMRQANKWHVLPASRVKVGLDDAENNLPPDRYFGWDNERPSRTISVPSFIAQSRCISNGEYAKFLEETSTANVPAGWSVDSGSVDKRDGSRIFIDAKLGPDLVSFETASWNYVSDKAVKTVYGLIPLSLALDWPIMASYDELAAYARWANGRIPTFEETKSIYQYVENQKTQLEVVQVPSGLISAVNGHLSNEGVEETPPHKPKLPPAVNGDDTAGPNPKGLFIDLDGCQVAYKAWHPTAITGEGDKLRGQSDTGGLWEWTSSPLAAWEEFKAMDLYPGYTADFFDGKHNIILGGSWATPPRIAGRKSFVNWYQRNYPYTWATARLVRDMA